MEQPAPSTLSWRRRLALSSSPRARLVRDAYRSVNRFSLPIPRPLGLAIRTSVLVLRVAYHRLFSGLVAAPLLKAFCKSYGKRLRVGVYLPWITGGGEIELGDDCNVVGKLTVVFASRFADMPHLIVGNRSGIGHGCEFSIAKEIRIGNYCHIAGGTRMFDSNGHPLDPAARLADLPPADVDVKPIRICDNVWIGADCIIFPGVTVGENSVVATGSVVTSDVPPNTLVAGYPARQIKRLG